MNLCVIPARGGSKRIPRKNIKLFAGKPMIAHAIETAKNSELFEHVVVSTDDAEISDIAKSLGAETPFMRPPNLADDHTPTAQVVMHAIDKCSKVYQEPEFVCCIYPCVPLLSAKDLKNSYSSMKEKKVSSCMPIIEFQSAPQRALKVENNGCVKCIYPEFILTRTQDLMTAYYDAGQFYWGTARAWKENKISSGLGFPLPSWRFVDIDTPEDWHRAELYYHFLSTKMHLK
jgi:pseudaminic acid cytidylyltransferase